jgi:ribonuclease P protein component
VIGEPFPRGFGLSRMEPIQPDLRLRKHEHLRRPADFQAVYDARASVSDAWLLLFAKPNGLPYARLGLSVSRKWGSAVVRNRIRRVFREAFRLSRVELPVGLDLILIPRSPNPPTTPTVQQSLTALARRLARRLGSRGASCSKPD